MRICRRRRAQRAVFIVGKSCIGPITIANLVVAPNGSDAIAIVVPKKIVPETLRFLGRRIYASLVVVLITTMIHGLKQGRGRRIREASQIDSRTHSGFLQSPPVCVLICAQEADE